MILSDGAIRWHLDALNLRVDPTPEDWQFQPASLELRIGEDLVLAPGEFRLSHTLEAVATGTTLAGRLSGKSSLGRLGLLVHATAGFIDPGFVGQITLELKNLSGAAIYLTKGQPVCQLELHQVAGTVLRPYGHPELGSHYQGQTGTTPSHLEPL